MTPERHPIPYSGQTEAPATSRRPSYSSRIPPSETGPYDDALRPSARGRGPSLTNRVLFYGGAGILAAAATAAAVLAARKLTDSDDGPSSTFRPARERSSAPRFAELDESEREEIRQRARERARADRNRAARLRAKAARERAAPRRNLARDVTETAENLSVSIQGAVAALSGALTGFQQVARQAGGVLREFSDAADTFRGVLARPEDRTGTTTGLQAETRRSTTAEMPQRDGTVRLAEEDRDTHDRMHRL